MDGKRIRCLQIVSPCAHLTITVSEIQRYICENVVILSYPLAFDAPLRGVPVGISAPRLVWKTRIAWLSDGEKSSKISLFVLAQLTNVTDRRTDGRTPRAGVVR